MLKLHVYEIFFNNQLCLRFFKVLCFSLMSVQAIAQDQHKIDSLERLVEVQSEVNQIEPLIQLAIIHADRDNSLSITYIDRAFRLASETSDSAKIVRAGRLKGQLLRRADKVDESIDIFVKLLPTARRNNYISDYKIMLNSLALAYTLKADYDKALDYNFQSLVIREGEGNKAEISISLNNIGLVYFKLKNYEKAVEYYEKSLLFKKEANDTYDLDRLLINLGISHVHLKKPDQAKKYIEEGLKICSNDCNPEISIGGRFGLGVANFYLEDYKEAEEHFKESLELSRESNNKRFQAENLIYLGRVSAKESDFLRAQSFLKEAEIIADSAGYNQLLIDTFKEFSRLFSLSKEYQKASEYQNKYISLKDSLIGEELVKNIAKIQTNFEERENLATIKLKEEALERQRKLNIAIGVIAVLAGLLGFVLYRSNMVIRKANSDLSDAKEVIVMQNQQLQDSNRELDGKVIAKTAELRKANEDLDRTNKTLKQVNDELDNFIYKTSHDIRGPLASLKGICTVALLDVTDEKALDYLTRLDISSGRLNVILTRLLIVNQINNTILTEEKIDFGAIVEDIMLLERKKGLPPRLEIKRDIGTDVALHSDKDLVRIVLENLIDNAIKFHNDSERVVPFVRITISNDAGKGITVSVVDNGIGIAEAKPDKIFQMFSRASERSGTGGIGLYLSKLATEKLGGKINLRTTSEGHTEFYVFFPLKMPVA